MRRPSKPRPNYPAEGSSYRSPKAEEKEWHVLLKSFESDKRSRREAEQWARDAQKKGL